MNSKKERFQKDFIDSMHNYHRNLMAISEEIENTEIEKIEIIKNKVLFYIKNPGKSKLPVLMLI